MRRWIAIFPLVLLLTSGASRSATVKKSYYAHDAVLDRHSVIAPWYKGQNGQLDYRLRIAAETMKRYPWTDETRSIRALPEYIYSSLWNIAPDGTITVPPSKNWSNGDLGQRSAYVLSGLVDYYRYSGDAAAIAHMTWMADFLLDYCQTPPDHLWPSFLISVPTKGKLYGRCDPKGQIQLDIVAEVGLPLLRAYQITGNRRWFEAAKHWGDLFAQKRSRAPGAPPWPRYANPEDTPWPTENKLTGGVAFILYFLDELIRLGYTGENDSIIEARNAGREYLRDLLLPNWTVKDTFGRNYWDTPGLWQQENVTEFVARYLMDNKSFFPNWRNDVRNLLSLFLNHTSVNIGSSGDVYSGAWAYPESSACCGRSLWYGPMEVSWPFTQYAVEADSEWAREIARRSQILATYDIHETGVTEDNIDGGFVVNGKWFKIAHPMALKHMLATIAWLPEIFGPGRENHIIRNTAVVSDVWYGKGRIHYKTFTAPIETVDVLRLSFIPQAVRAGVRLLTLRKDLTANGYTVKYLPNGDCVVSVRHDGAKTVTIEGVDPQEVVDRAWIRYDGDWTTYPLMRGNEPKRHEASATGAKMTCRFVGNQLRLIGRTEPDGGLADVYLDGEKQLVGIDCWNPSLRDEQVLYYRNGLENGPHVLMVVTTGKGNPFSKGSTVYLQRVQTSRETGASGFGEGGGPKGAQRWVFGYAGSKDYEDSKGGMWRPGTEFVVRFGDRNEDSVAQSWWTEPAEGRITNTSDPELYRYGVHAPEITVNFTVGPGRYHVRIKFAANRHVPFNPGPMDVSINGKELVKGLDVPATAGGRDRAVDLVFDDIAPRNGIVEVRLTGSNRVEGGSVVRMDAFVQAIEVGPGKGGRGVKPATSPKP